MDGQLYAFACSLQRRRGHERGSAAADCGQRRPHELGYAQSVPELGLSPHAQEKLGDRLLTEARDGFPFSVQQPDGQVVGAVNSHRLPFWFNLNLHLERRFRWRGYRFAIRGGFNNITDHNNATLANNIIGSPQYLTYFGSEGRHLVFLLRWLGKD